MKRNNSSRTTRRSYLKRAGVSVGALALAGCAGGGGGGEGDSESSSGDGSDSSGSTGTVTDSQEFQEVNMILSPGGFAGIIYDQMTKQTNRLENRMNEEGYTVNAQESWENAALFAAGGPDFSDIAGLEATTLATERELDLVTFGKTISNFVGFITRIGSRFDPDNTGGLEESLNLLANEGRLAIGSWGGGDVPAEKIILEDQFGLTLDEDQGDFEVVTADYFALPQLLADEEVAAVSTAPQYGAASLFLPDDPALKGLFWNADQLDEMGYGPRPINGWTTTREFVDNNPGAVRALVEAHEETVADFLSRPYELSTTEPYTEFLTAQNEQEAEFLVDFCIKNEYSWESPLMYETVSLDETAIEEETQYINRAAELGDVPSNWQEYLEFVNVNNL
jgi:hypothetical protein